MPAAAVIPAPIAYIKVVAVKKLVVGSACRAVGSPPVGVTGMFAACPVGGEQGPRCCIRLLKADVSVVCTFVGRSLLLRCS